MPCLVACVFTGLTARVLQGPKVILLLILSALWVDGNLPINLLSNLPVIRFHRVSIFPSIK